MQCGCDDIKKEEGALVSVIVPNYNYAGFLRQRLDSILNQTYRHIELIILDDCSTDDSRTIIESYRADSRVKQIIYNECNSGSTFVQWKKGFSKANGEYIWIAECDDYADTSFLEKIMSVMQQDEDIKIGFSNSYWVTPDSTFINKDYTVPDKVNVYEGKSFVRHHLMKENYIYNASMAVFRKDALTGVNQDYARYVSCGDKLFWASIATQGKVLFYCEPLNYFRIHSTKVTTKSIANGTLFREEHDLFQRNIREGYISLRNRWSVVDYFLRYVNRTKGVFLTDSIYKECLQMWEEEADYRNSRLPFLYRLICLMKNPRRRTYSA